ncbi:hypothetical protein AB0C52_35950 [Streptomyces sp. NPDC048717]|uniref:hypothetical protein n=1 Tax=Streptomyces sp. NPDC048717 TaxID=3154928 RepID=UPI0034136C12
MDQNSAVKPRPSSSLSLVAQAQAGWGDEDVILTQVGILKACSFPIRHCRAFASFLMS